MEKDEEREMQERGGGGGDGEKTVEEEDGCRAEKQCVKTTRLNAASLDKRGLTALLLSSVNMLRYLRAIYKTKL